MFGTANSSVRKTLAATTAVFFFLFTACNSAPEKSGECYYDRVDTLAEVTELKPHPDGNGRIAVILDFKASPLAFKAQELGELMDFTIDHDFLVRNNIEIGNQYEFVVSTITSGDCTPQIVAFNHAFD